MLISRVTQDKLVQSVAGHVAEQIAEGRSLRDNLDTFTFAVDYVLEHGGNVDVVTADAKRTCESILKKNRQKLEMLAHILSLGIELTEEDIDNLFREHV